MKLTLKTAKLLQRLIDGEVLAYSLAKSKLTDDLVAENLLYKKGKHRKTLKLINENALHLYLANQCQIQNLQEYIAALSNQHTTRADFVKITSDSKDSKERAFKGFLVNSYHAIEAKLNKAHIIIQPSLGSFTFIYDFETFVIPKEVTIVGVENAKNFSTIHAQQYLFEHISPLFISRYPQNQNKDVIKWLTSIPNNYLHFGDFDIAGIGIYLNEYKCHLGKKASFFIPNTIQNDLHQFGNRNRFHIQKSNFTPEIIDEPKLLDLLTLIKIEKKGLDQEYYINA